MSDNTPNPVPLDYRTAEYRRFDWRILIRLFSLGPFTGAVVGMSSSAASLLVWLVFGRPDFFFRGWSGVEAHFIMLAVGGAALGMFYGVALLGYELLWRRRIPLPLTTVILATAMFALSGIVTVHEFQNHQIEWSGAPELGTAGFGFLLSLAISRPKTSETMKERRD